VNRGVIFHLCTWTFLDLVVSSQVGFGSCQIFFMSGWKHKKTSCQFSSSKKRKVQHRTNKIFGSERPWVENSWRNSRTLVLPMKLKDKLQQVLVMCTKLLVQISKLPQQRVKHRCGCRRCRPQDFLFLASRRMVSKMFGEQRSLNLRNIIPMLPTKSSKKKKSRQFKYKPV